MSGAPERAPDSAPDCAIVARFRDDVTQVLGRVVLPAEPVALAVSGGADSMAMLALAASAFPGQVIAATMDHRLRSAAADEAAMVAAYCATIGVPHVTLYPAAPIDPTNVQAGARLARYQALQQWAAAAGATLLATAHHADDQAETFLMRAARGSGVAGLAGVRAQQRCEVHLPDTSAETATDVHPIDLIRPLLGWRAAALRAIVVAQGIPYVDDPSNVDPRYDRSHFRQLLAANPVLDPVQLARAASHADEADAALRTVAAWLWDTRRLVPRDVADPDGQTWIDMTDLPRELKRRLCRSAIASVRRAKGITRPDFSDATNIESLLDSLDEGKSATQAGVMVRKSRGIWRFYAAPARRSA